MSRPLPLPLPTPLQALPPQAPTQHLPAPSTPLPVQLAAPTTRQAPLLTPLPAPSTPLPVQLAAPTTRRVPLLTPQPALLPPAPTLPLPATSTPLRAPLPMLLQHPWRFIPLPPFLPRAAGGSCSRTKLRLPRPPDLPHSPPPRQRARRRQQSLCAPLCRECFRRALTPLRATMPLPALLPPAQTSLLVPQLLPPTPLRATTPLPAQLPPAQTSLLAPLLLPPTPHRATTPLPAQLLPPPQPTLPRRPTPAPALRLRRCPPRPPAPFQASTLSCSPAATWPPWMLRGACWAPPTPL